jgi:L-idonate 5-dehydrogenase
MEHVRALVVRKAGDFGVEQIPLREPEPNECVVDMAFGGICGSDLHYVSHGAAGNSILREPMVLGHEVVGVVSREAADGSGPAFGTAVAIHPANAGGPDAVFPPGRPNLSDRGTYLGSAAHLPHTAGAFAERAVFASSMLRELPAGLSLRDAAIVEPAAVSWHAVARAGDVQGKRVAVIGSGAIGALTVAILKRAGAGEIIATDMHDLPLSVATKVGATRTVHAGDADAIAALRADIVFESSGSTRGLDSALRAARAGGRVMMVGLIPPGPQPVELSIAISRELELLGSFRSVVEEMDEVIAALGDGSLDTAAVVTHEFSLDDAAEAFALAADSSRSGKVLLRLGA